MGRATVSQEVRIMRFEDIYGRFQGSQLSCEDAADLPGVVGVAILIFSRHWFLVREAQ